MAEDIKAPEVKVSPEKHKLSQAQIIVAKKIYDAAMAANVDPNFALAVGWQENKFHPVGKSEAGAIGPMQVMPSTAHLYNVSIDDLADPDTNINLGIRILKDGLDRHDGNKRAAIVDYNASPSTAKKFIESNENIKVLPKETQNYLNAVNEIYPLNDEAPEGTNKIQTGKSNPFDYDLNQPKESKGFEDVFGPTEDLPEHLVNEVPAVPEKENVVTQTAKEAYENPVTAGAVVAPFTAMKQRSINKDFREAERMRRNAAINKEMLDEQFKNQQAEEMAGDKWSRKVVGSMGPGGESVTEASRNYRIQQGLSPEETPKFGVSRQGIIVPKTVQQALEEEAVQRPSLKTIVPKVRAPLEAIGASKIGRSPLLTGAATVGAGYYIDEAREREQAGDWLGASISHIKALGAGMTAIPTYPTVPVSRMIRGAGILGTAAGEGLDILKEAVAPYQSVTKQPPQLKKADGGYIPLSLKHVHFHRQKRQG